MGLEAGGKEDRMVGVKIFNLFGVVHVTGCNALLCFSGRAGLLLMMHVFALLLVSSLIVVIVDNVGWES